MKDAIISTREGFMNPLNQNVAKDSFSLPQTQEKEGAKIANGFQKHQYGLVNGNHTELKNLSHKTQEIASNSLSQDQIEVEIENPFSEMNAIDLTDTAHDFDINLEDLADIFSSFDAQAEILNINIEIKKENLQIIDENLQAKEKNLQVKKENLQAKEENLQALNENANIQAEAAKNEKINTEIEQILAAHSEEINKVLSDKTEFLNHAFIADFKDGKLTHTSAKNAGPDELDKAMSQGRIMFLKNGILSIDPRAITTLFPGRDLRPGDKITITNEHGEEQEVTLHFLDQNQVSQLNSYLKEYLKNRPMINQPRQENIPEEKKEQKADPKDLYLIKNQTINAKLTPPDEHIKNGSKENGSRISLATQELATQTKGKKERAEKEKTEEKRTNEEKWEAKEIKQEREKKETIKQEKISTETIKNSNIEETPLIPSSHTPKPKHPKVPPLETRIRKRRVE